MKPLCAVCHLELDWSLGAYLATHPDERVHKDCRLPYDLPKAIRLKSLSNQAKG